MIYVMSGSRRETLRWATAQGIPYRHARHVYDAQTLPGRIAGVRFVKLESFDTLRNRHAIIARLKRANYRDIEVELWRENETGDWYQVLGEPVPADPEAEIDIPVDGPSDDSVEEPQDDTPTAEPEPEPEAPAAESDDVDSLEQFIGLTEASTPEDEEEDSLRSSLPEEPDDSAGAGSDAFGAGATWAGSLRRPLSGRGCGEVGAKMRLSDL